jgi:hypothetical protein
MITNATMMTYENVVAVVIAVAKATMVASANMVANTNNERRPPFGAALYSPAGRLPEPGLIRFRPCG